MKKRVKHRPASKNNYEKYLMNVYRLCGTDHSGPIAEPNRELVGAKYEADNESSVELFSEHLSHVAENLFDCTCPVVQCNAPFDFQDDMNLEPPKFLGLYLLGEISTSEDMEIRD